MGAVLALLALPATGHAKTGGAPTGGASYGATPPRLVASRFTLTPRTLKPGAALGIRYRIDGTRREVHARVDVLPVGSRQPTARIGLGWKRPGRTQTRKWTPAAGKLPPVVGSGRFPVQGKYTYGDRFGVKRGTATHRGQDILAASGTPVVSPRAGVVSWRAYQAQGAGNYIVIDADDGRDFVFMHLRDGSVTVEKEATVSAGQVIGQVGQTGDATAPHLHFEIWPTGWYSSDASQPVDPMPDLQAWAAA
jgi:murein DD-endopeptidase MepM/ murein hydrolase activator NlpD